MPGLPSVGKAFIVTSIVTTNVIPVALCAGLFFPKHIDTLFKIGVIGIPLSLGLLITGVAVCEISKRITPDNC